ncbi:hypothetical protein Kfla_4199 [Kribbella flavida DSM 17836]|uniref:Uncharacterized protein n=1 Tax=Kribbella flavida (strain DSM 17836 / JCM 10339 / NBRC 14399) TaxID=479435 RepID=D2PTV7_KRIFD|nr:hypothetical protein [Kribbella flavida]ADB33240.1 hypothetical protein Kfla_4199 [Kribbella flavida DSM 17836]
MAAWGLVTALAVGLLPDGAASWVSGGLGVIGLWIFALVMMVESTGSVESTAAYGYHGKYLHAKDWDADAQRLMLRAQAAVRAVRDAEVSKDGLLDDIRNDVVRAEAALQEALRDDGYVAVLACTATIDQSRLVERLSEEAVELKQQLTKSVAAALETGRALDLPINDGPAT